MAEVEGLGRAWALAELMMLMQIPSKNIVKESKTIDLVDLA
jgi:hypothetical protein